MEHSSDEIFEKIISLCEDVAWGRTIQEESLYSYTIEGATSEKLRQLAEVFGFMLVKLGVREEYNNRLISELTQKNTELEEIKNLVQKRNSKLMEIVQTQHNAKRIIGQCEPMQKAIKFALSIAKRPVNTMLLGETGTGKEEFAKLIHFSSERCEGPFIAVNCSAIPDTLFESEMFGIEKGVATGVAQKKGMFEEANKGTLFLDEIADMPLAHQAKLLRVLEEQELTRVGSVKTIALDIKVISAANINLEQAVKNGSFRMDLFYRLNVAEIQIPPLRQRGDDILLLAQRFLDFHCYQMKQQKLGISQSARQALLSYPWPGNVRELNNEMERAVVLSLGENVELEDLSPKIVETLKKQTVNYLKSPAPLPSLNLQTRQIENLGNYQQAEKEDQKNTSPKNLNLLDMEKYYISQALEKTNGNRSQAAGLLGITREGLRKKLLRFDIQDSE